MSLFAALMGDLDDDPFIGGHMRRMNTMMNSFFRDPFGDGMMGGRGLSTELMPYGAASSRQGGGGRQLMRDDFPLGFPMMPIGFPNMRNIFHDIGSNPSANCHSFSSSTVMTMTAGPDGRPQVYQASQSVKQGPGGIRETKKSVADSRSGIKKMSIGHHINDRAHIIQRQQNVYSGEQEESQDFINLDEEEAESFDKEWQSKTRHLMKHNAIEYGNGKGSRRHGQRQPQLALPSTHTHNWRVSGRARAPSLQLASSSHASSEREEGAREEERERDTRKRRLSDKEKGVQVEEIRSDSDDDEDSDDEPKAKQLRGSSPPSSSPSAE